MCRNTLRYRMNTDETYESHHSNCVSVFRHRTKVKFQKAWPSMRAVLSLWTNLEQNQFFFCCRQILPETTDTEKTLCIQSHFSLHKNNSFYFSSISMRFYHLFSIQTIDNQINVLDTKKIFSALFKFSNGFCLEICPLKTENAILIQSSHTYTYRANSFANIYCGLWH